MSYELSFPTNTFTNIDNELYKQENPNTNFSKLVPTRLVPENTQTIMTIGVTQSGEAKPITGALAEKIPQLDFSANRMTNKVINWGFGFHVDLPDIQAEQSGDISPLETYAEGAFEAFDKGLYKLAIEGYEELGIKGLKNLEGLATTTLTQKLTHPDTTPQSMLNVFNAATVAVSAQTGNVRPANTIVMSLEILNLLNTTRFGTDGQGTSVLNAFLENIAVINGGVVPTLEINDSFATEVLIYSFDTKVFNMPIAMDLTRLPEQWSGYGYNVNYLYRVGGIGLKNTLPFHRIKNVL